MFEMIKAQLSSSVPFAKHAKIEILEIADGTACAILPLDDDLKNHLGTQHAGALFTTGETASGAAFAGAFASMIMEVVPVAATANITYLKPAKTAIKAYAQIDGDGDMLRSTCRKEGKVRFLVNVSMKNEDGTEVAIMTVEWHVRMR